MRAAFESAPCPSLEMVCIIFLTTFFLGLSPPMFTHSVDLLVFVSISCHCLFTRVSCSVCSGQGTRSSTAWVSSPGRKSKGKKESQKTRGENNNNDRVFFHAGVRGRASALGVETRFTSLRTATRAPRTSNSGGEHTPTRKSGGNRGFQEARIPGRCFFWSGKHREARTHSM